MTPGIIQISREKESITIRIEFPIDALVRPPVTVEHVKEDPLIPIKQAPSVALVSRSTLDRMKKQGDISFTNIRGRIFFYESALKGIRVEHRLKRTKA